MLFTAVAVLVGVAVIGFAVLQQVSAPPAGADVYPPTVVVPTELADGRALGSADAPVTIEVWSDFQCPVCRTLATTLEPSLIQQFIVPGTVRLVYRDAAFQGQNGNDPSWDESVEAAAAARCATDQGLFWPMHEWLFANWNGENLGAFRQDRLRAIAEGAGLNVSSYDTCMAAGDKQVAVRNEKAQAISNGINATPTLVINGTFYQGAPAYNDLVNIINEAAASPIP